MVPKSGLFQEEFFLLSGQKKSQNWTGPCLSLQKKVHQVANAIAKMPNLRLKVRTQRRPAQCSSGDRLPERRSYDVLWGGLGSEGDKTVLLGPKNWNPISSSKCTVLFFLFFCLHCRASTGHGRSTTGNPQKM